MQCYDLIFMGEVLMGAWINFFLMLWNCFYINVKQNTIILLSESIFPKSARLLSEV